MHRRPPRRCISLTAQASSIAGLCSRLAFVPLVLCATVSAPLSAEDTGSLSPEGTQYSDTTDIVVVEVPITVTRNGEPVRDLTANNFQIKFDGKVQEIRSLEMIDLEPPTAGAKGNPVQTPITGRRHFLLLFDLANSEPHAIVRARRAARDVLHTMHPSDLVAVGLYDDIRGLEFLLGFTTDRHQVEIALDSFGVPGLFHPVNDPLQLTLAVGPGSEADSLLASGVGAGRGAELEQQVDQQVLQSVMALDRFQGIERVERMAESFESMAQGLASVQGQVHIVYLSEGFDSRLLLGNQFDSAQTRDNIEKGELWNVKSQARYGSSRLQNRFEEMIESLRRSGAVVHSVDVGGLRSEESVYYRQNADVLNAIAQDTGGELYDNFNNLADAMGLMLEATSVTYVATLQPLELPMDGEYRKLKVKLKDVPRRGTKVSHRAGFFAPRPFVLTDNVVKRLTSAQLILGSEEAGTIEFDAQAEVAPARQASTVTLRLELDGKGLKTASDERQQRQLRLFAYAFDEEGHIYDFFTQAVILDLDKLESEEYSARLDLNPGSYRIRILVRDLVSGEYGVRTAHVTVEPRDSTPGMSAEGLESHTTYPTAALRSPFIAISASTASRIRS